ncbi:MULTISPECIES: hypothetical protein [unclassified Bacillus (in: firmicutes)]|uniref:hypothetical protein n=1 Tax=unclassified Bacillus (in: firmicutes) TaxID=185979 RepID=UPI003010062B
MVTLFHCSNRVFDEFKISKELAVYKECELTEGYGIYMTENFSVASHYGDFVYSVAIKEEDVFDSTSKEEIQNLLDKVEKEVRINLADYMDVDDVILEILEGEASVRKLYKELNLRLDSNESFFSDFEDRITYESDCIQRQIEDVVIKNLNKIIKYYSKTQGDVYICHKNPEVLEIVNMQEKKLIA